MSNQALSVVKTGAVIAYNATSASIAIPTDSASTLPKYVRVASNAPCYVKIGVSGVTAVAGDLLVQPADAAILNVHNQTHIAAIQVSAAGTLQISPLEDR